LDYAILIFIEYKADIVCKSKRRMQMIKCIIFDIDGTLIDTEFAVKKSLQRVLREELREEYSLDSLDFALGIPGLDTLKKLSIKDADRVVDNWNKYMGEYKDHVKVFDGIVDALRALKAKDIKMGIVTSKTREEFERDFRPYGLMEYVDEYVCADDTKKHKPNPDPLLKFLEVSGVSDTEAIYIGDTNYDCLSAKGANIKFALALWGARNPDEVDADMKLESPQDITKTLNDPSYIDNMEKI